MRSKKSFSPFSAWKENCLTAALKERRGLFSLIFHQPPGELASALLTPTPPWQPSWTCSRSPLGETVLEGKGQWVCPWHYWGPGNPSTHLLLPATVSGRLSEMVLLELFSSSSSTMNSFNKYLESTGSVLGTRLDLGVAEQVQQAARVLRWNRPAPSTLLHERFYVARIQDLFSTLFSSTFYHHPRLLAPSTFPAHQPPLNKTTEQLCQQHIGHNLKNLVL